MPTFGWAPHRLVEQLLQRYKAEEEKQDKRLNQARAQRRLPKHPTEADVQFRNSLEQARSRLPSSALTTASAHVAESSKVSSGEGAISDPAHAKVPSALKVLPADAAPAGESQ